MQMRSNGRFKLVTVLLATATLTVLSVSAADARVGGSSAASRGLRSLLPAPATRTTPRPAKLLERTQHSGQPNRPGATTIAKVTQRPGLVGGFVAGFLGAGLLGLLFGNGFFAGVGGVASMMGLVLQIALFAFVGWLAWGWWQRRSSPAFAGLSPRQLADAYDRPRSDHTVRISGGGDVPIGKNDCESFERLLGEIQTAYGREDIAALRKRVTPEMLSRFSDEIDRNTGRGLHNQVSNVKLLQGDLAETWREDGRDFATVVMHFSLVDRMIERASERVVESGPGEVTELWTFVRASGGDWRLSAIRQT